MMTHAKSTFIEEVHTMPIHDIVIQGVRADGSFIYHVLVINDRNEITIRPPLSLMTPMAMDHQAYADAIAQHRQQDQEAEKILERLLSDKPTEGLSNEQQQRDLQNQKKMSDMLAAQIKTLEKSLEQAEANLRRQDSSLRQNMLYSLLNTSQTSSSEKNDLLIEALEAEIKREDNSESIKALNELEADNQYCKVIDNDNQTHFATMTKTEFESYRQKKEALGCQIETLEPFNYAKQQYAHQVQQPIQQKIETTTQAIRELNDLRNRLPNVEETNKLTTKQSKPQTKQLSTDVASRAHELGQINVTKQYQQSRKKTGSLLKAFERGNKNRIGQCKLIQDHLNKIMGLSKSGQVDNSDLLGELYELEKTLRDVKTEIKGESKHLGKSGLEHLCQEIQEKHINPLKNELSKMAPESFIAPKNK